MKLAFSITNSKRFPSVKSDQAMREAVHAEMVLGQPWASATLNMHLAIRLPAFPADLRHRMACEMGGRKPGDFTNMLASNSV